MAFPLAQATGKSYPLPWAPQIRRKYRSIVIYRIIALLLRWFAAIGVIAWICTMWVLALLPSWIMQMLPEVKWAIPLMIAVTLFLLKTSDNSVKTPLIHAFGYGRAGANTVSGRHSKPPKSLAHITTAVACSGASLGIITGTGVAFIQTDIFPDLHSQNMLLSLFTAGSALLAGLLAWAGVHTARKSMAGWRKEINQEQITSHLLAHGEHVIGKVTNIIFEDSWLDQQPIFTLCVEYQAAGETCTMTFHYVDYPRWAPVIGNEFEIWFDPKQSNDPKHILLERKIVGQTFASDIEHLRRPASGGDGPDLGPLAPKWAQSEKHNKTRTTVKIVIQLFFAVLFTAGSAVSLIMWTMVFGSKPWWLLLCFLIISGSFSLNAICGISLLNRSQWLIRTTWAVDTVGWTAYMFMFPAVLGIALKSVDLLWERTSSLPVEQVMVLLFTGFIVVFGSLFSVISSTTFHETIARVFTAGTLPPAEEVHEALRSSNPAKLEALEKHYSYITGALHTRS